MNFSVLLSLYIKERPEFLKECLESLKNQTLPATEIVMVYDGAITPELEAVVNEYTTKLPMKIIQLPKNVGMGNAFNEGLKNCSYEWVFRMDTDDICLPHRFEKQVNFIKQNPSVVLLGSHIAEFNNINDIVSYRKIPIGNQAIRKYSLARTPFNHMTVAYKKQIAIDAGGYRSYLLEDYSLWLRIIAKNYEVGNIDDVLVYARIGNNMVSRRRGKEYIKGEWQLFKLKRSLKLQPLLPNFFIFTLRASLRILPTNLLKVVYKFLRKMR